MLHACLGLLSLLISEISVSRDDLADDVSFTPYAIFSYLLSVLPNSFGLLD